LNTQLVLHLISIFGYDMRARSAGNGAKVSTIPSFSAAELAAPSGQRACAKIFSRDLVGRGLTRAAPHFEGPPSPASHLFVRAHYVGAYHAKCPGSSFRGIHATPRFLKKTLGLAAERQLDGSISWSSQRARAAS
jgi:hypothetical protein